MHVFWYVSRLGKWTSLTFTHKHAYAHNNPLNEPSSHQTPAISAIHLHSILFCRLPDVTSLAVQQQAQFLCSCLYVFVMWNLISNKINRQTSISTMHIPIGFFFFTMQTHSQVFSTRLLFSLLFYFTTSVRSKYVELFINFYDCVCNSCQQFFFVSIDIQYNGMISMLSTLSMHCRQFETLNHRTNSNLLNL